MSLFKLPAIMAATRMIDNAFKKTGIELGRQSGGVGVLLGMSLDLAAGPKGSAPFGSEAPHRLHLLFRVGVRGAVLCGEVFASQYPAGDEHADGAADHARLGLLADSGEPARGAQVGAAGWHAAGGVALLPARGPVGVPARLQLPDSPNEFKVGYETASVKAVSASLLALLVRSPVSDRRVDAHRRPGRRVGLPGRRAGVHRGLPASNLLV
mmetsp:Transcript_96120/g.299383  ORF Transcript_96120/g.299383 Transcript_96120/m.299383 type:complete len:211 (+) Transcript_96120:75-707(+)